MEQEIYKQADLVLNHLKKKSDSCARVISFNSREGRLTVLFLKDNGLITLREENITASTIADITPRGLEALKKGVAAYAKDIKERKSQKEHFEFEKLKYDVKNAKRVFKTYWFTFAIAIAGFLIAIINLILTLNKK